MSRLAAIACFLLLFLPAAAQGASPFEVLNRSATDVSGDGERFVTFQPGRPGLGGGFAVVDTWTGANRSYPRGGCTAPSSVTAAGRGLVDCFEDGASFDRLVDLRTGQLTDLPRTVEVDGVDQEVSWFAVGRHWIAGIAERRVHLNWRSEEVRVSSEEPHVETAQLDLDDPALGPVRTCPAYQALPRDARGSFVAPRFLEVRNGLLLRGCEGMRRRLTRAAVDRSGIAGKVAYWTRSSTLHTYGEATGRRRAVRIPGFQRGFDEPLDVVVARRVIVLAVAVEQDCDKTCFATESDLLLIRPRR